MYKYEKPKCQMVECNTVLWCAQSGPEPIRRVYLVDSNQWITLDWIFPLCATFCHDPHTKDQVSPRCCKLLPQHIHVEPQSVVLATLLWHCLLIDLHLSQQLVTDFSP